MVARFVFVVLGLLSAWLTYTGIRTRFGLPWAERRRMDLPLDHMGSRIWRFVTEVLLQSRVIRNRPVVGILHALVMWGFIAFVGGVVIGDGTATFAGHCYKIAGEYHSGIIT